MSTVPGLRAAILAGGSGQRFWPLSRELSPKQLLSMFGTESLIVQTIRRVTGLVEGGASGVTIVTNERLLDELRNHLTAQHDRHLTGVQYLLEPRARNTAAAVALAAAALEAEDPDGVLLVLPSDHVLDDDDAWREAVRAAAAAAGEGWLVTVGIHPTRPETGYGYIRRGEPLQLAAGPEAGVVGDITGEVTHDVTHDLTGDITAGGPPDTRASSIVLRAEEFVEKPEFATAEQFLASGSYLWNAGIFVMKAATALAEFDAAGPDASRIAQTARWFAALPEDERAGDEARRRFDELPAVSFDKAVMEHSARVAVVPAALAWDDVGSLQALGAVAPRDEDGNMRVGRGIDIDSRDNVVYATDRLVATLGVNDLIVADTPDATLVLHKDRAQDVRLVVEALAAQGAEELLQPRTSLRPWGSWTTLLKGPNYHIKLMEIHPGAKLSLQKHAHRSEHWVVVGGTARVTREAETIEVHVNESAFIPIGATHRIENCGKVHLKVIEVQVGEYVAEDDIVRVEDDWAREEQ